ncbi:uncharacterized protein LOC119289572 [Triticum dicoccoides]|uniref:F-box protein AT5G49610-like beta-propeller domain-containing protein n=1 Tax=Triticum turgidum subsp. durum TaxID=4567 RepID=A0A9R0SN11_TRITD|nr:uncharacterized protein LOC119289572 [Triticum dicoccoides]VAH98063.1 unnamed protein product [Triticum turgidum subsp. durum]
MTTNSPPGPGPKRKRDSEPTSLMSLGDDMLAEILSRLPSLPSLASAALASPWLCGVASSPAVLNPFLSRAPLLGYFVSVADGAVPAFHRALLRRDRHLAAVVRRGDFHLTDLEYDGRLMDCRHGLILLSSRRQLVVFDPVSRSRLHIPIPEKHIYSRSLHCFLPACGGGPTSFSVLSMEKKGGRVRTRVYSSRTGEWCSHSWAPKGIKGPRESKLGWPMHAGGRIYWRSVTGDQLTSLDVGAMEFSHVELPGNLHNQPRSYPYAVGETEDGTTCLVAMSRKLVLQVWFRMEEDKSWELQRQVNASRWYLPRGRLQKVCDVTAGVVLLSMGTENGGLHHYAFRLKNVLEEGTTTTRPELEADFFIFDARVHPYFMAWPRPSLKAAGSSNTKKTSLKDQEAGGSKKNKKTSVKDQEACSSKKN